MVAGGVVVMTLLDHRLRSQMGDRCHRLRLRGPRADRALTLSPLGQIMTRVVTPRLHLAARPVAGPPKRFAQGIGVGFSVAALVLTILGYWGAAQIVLGLLAVAALLESALRPVPWLQGIRRAHAARAWFPQRSARGVATSGHRRELPNPSRCSPPCGCSGAPTRTGRGRLPGVAACSVPLCARGDSPYRRSTGRTWPSLASR